MTCRESRRGPCLSGMMADSQPASAIHQERYLRLESQVNLKETFPMPDKPTLFVTFVSCRILPVGSVMHLNTSAPDLQVRHGESMDNLVRRDIIHFFTIVLKQHWF